MHPTDPVHEAQRDAFDTAVERLAQHQTQNGASDILNFTEAAKLVGVSRGRLYRAIWSGRLDAMPGGGPGKPTMVSREALRQAGFRAREDSAAVAERSIMQTPAEAERLMERFADHVVDRLAERLTQDLRAALAPMLEDLIRQGMAGRQAHMERSGTSHKTAQALSRLAILTRLRTWKREGVSTRQMAERLEAEGVPTLSGRGAWTSGAISRLMQESERSERSDKDDLPPVTSSITP